MKLKIKDMKVIFTAISIENSGNWDTFCPEFSICIILKITTLINRIIHKRNFFHRFSISKYALNQGYVPINPFMNFDYFLGEGIERDKVRKANNKLVEMCDELWVFGDISNGVEAEIKLAEQMQKKTRYFTIDKNADIQEIEKSQTIMEDETYESKIPQRRRI